MSDMTERQELRISQFSAQFGLNPKTLRYYEQIGLIDPPRRSATGHRLYDAAAQDRVRFILKAKAIGLTLDEVGQIVALQRQAGRPCQRVVAMLEDKIVAIKRQYQALAEFRKELIALRDTATQGSLATSDFDVCPIIGRYEPDPRIQAALAAAARHTTAAKPDRA